MKEIKTIYITMILCLLISSCDQALSYNDYKKWISNPENGLYVKKHIQEYILQVQFQPNDFLNAQLQKTERESNELYDLQQYILTLGIENKKFDFMKYNTKSISDYQKKEYYFSYLFQDDIFLEENGKQYPCILYHFEKSNNLKNTISAVLGFNNEVKSSEATLVIKSKILSGLPIKIKISKQNIPQLASYEPTL